MDGTYQSSFLMKKIHWSINDCAKRMMLFGQSLIKNPSGFIMLAFIKEINLQQIKSYYSASQTCLMVALSFLIQSIGGSPNVDGHRFTGRSSNAARYLARSKK